MNSRYILALLASLGLIAACGQGAEEPAAATEPAAEEMVEHTAGMVLPATTSSDAAREHYMAAWADFENARFNSAHSQFLDAAAADPAFAMAHLMSALTSTSTEGFTGNLAQAGANKAGASEGEQLMVLAFESALVGDTEAWIAALEELTALHPDSPRAWVFLGNAYGNINNTSDARAAYVTAIGLDATLVPAHINLGNSLLAQEPKDFGMAETHIKHAIAITPDEPNPHDLLGDVHRAQGNLDAAYEDYSRAAELAPELGSALQQRGHVNSFLGNYDEARADYTRAADLEDARGTNNGGFFLVFRTYVSVHEGNTEAAIAELQELADGADPATMEGALDLKVNALTNAALFATETGNSDAANAYIDSAASVMRQQADAIGSDEVRDAQEATVSYMQGLLAARTGDADTAAAKAAEFEGHAASSSNPRKLERMHEILGMSAYMQEDYAGAVEHLAAGDHQNNMYTKYYLARANEAAGNADEAARLYGELAVYNFNGPGYAMFRKDILERAASE